MPLVVILLPGFLLFFYGIITQILIFLLPPQIECCLPQEATDQEEQRQYTATKHTQVLTLK